MSESEYTPGDRVLVAGKIVAENGQGFETARLVRIESSIGDGVCLVPAGDVYPVAVTQDAEADAGDLPPRVEDDHRCKYRGQAADRALVRDEFYRLFRAAVARRDEVVSAVLAIHYPEPTWTDSTITDDGEEENAFYAEDGTLIYAADYRLQCHACYREVHTWPCATAAAVGATA